MIDYTVTFGGCYDSQNGKRGQDPFDLGAVMSTTDANDIFRLAEP
jgi:hypothetical protein